MTSNLPPGCSESDIPGNSLIDKVVDKAIADNECVACRWLDVEGTSYCSYCENKDTFDPLEDLTKIAERIRAEADAREDGHSDD